LYNQIDAGTYPSTMPNIFVNPGDATTGAQSGVTMATGYTPGLYQANRYVYVSNPYKYESSNSNGVWSGSSYSYSYTGGGYLNGYSYSSSSRPRTIPQIFVDGTSNTLLIAEQVTACSSYYYQQWNYVSGLYTYYQYYDFGYAPYNPYIYSQGPQGVKAGLTYQNCGTYYYNYLISTRQSGPQFVAADGSVHTINPSVTQTALMNLLTPDDGTPLATGTFD